MSSVSSGSESGRMKYLIVDPRTLMVSRDMVSEAPGVLLFLGVILTVRRAVFIWGVTEAIVPETMVPFLSSRVTDSFWHFMRNLHGCHVSGR